MPKGENTISMRDTLSI